MEPILLNGARLQARRSGALWWPDESLLCVSDLHLGKSERMARRGWAPLPPYETQDTLQRLADEIDATSAKQVVCLGDSFDDTAAAEALPEDAQRWITRLQAGRRWIWIEGNHDPGPVEIGGAHHAGLTIGPLTFRHIAQPNAQGEISGHYHPKLQLQTRARRITRPVFLYDATRLILPAFGTYTGGLSCADPVFAPLFASQAFAILTGPTARTVPFTPGLSL